MKKILFTAMLMSFALHPVIAQQQTSAPAQRQKMEKFIQEQRQRENLRKESDNNLQSQLSKLQQQEAHRQFSDANLKLSHESEKQWDALEQIHRMAPIDRLKKLRTHHVQPINVPVQPVMATKAITGKSLAAMNDEKILRLDSVWNKNYGEFSTYKYNEQGYPTEITSYYRSAYSRYKEPRMRQRYEFDERGFVTLDIREEFNDYWIIKSKMECSHDSRGNITSYSEVSYDKNRIRGIQKYESEFDSRNRVTSHTEYQWDNNLNEWIAFGKFEYKFSDNGRLLSEAAYYLDNSTHELRGEYKHEYAYDDYGNETMFATYYWLDGKWYGGSRYVSTFDSRGRELEYSTYVWKNDKWILSEYDAYEYDDANSSGTIYAYNVDEDGNKSLESKSELTFDEKGNYKEGTLYVLTDEGEFIKTAEAVWEYDSNGRMLSYHLYTSDDNWNTRYEMEGEEHKYDSANRLIFHKKIDVNNDGEPYVSEYSEYAYDDKGNCTLTLELTRNNNGTVTKAKRREYKYDDKGNQILYLNYTWDNSTNDWAYSSKTESVFNEDGKRTLYAEYNWSTSLNAWVGSTKEETSYSSNTNTIIYYKWDKTANDWFVDHKNTNTYDTNGLIVNSTQYIPSESGDEWIVSYVNERAYDSNGNQIYSRTKYYNNGEVFGYDYTELAYDDNHNVILQLKHRWNYETNDWMQDYKYEFAFDTYGNRTKYKYYYYNEETGKWELSYGSECMYDERGNELKRTEYGWYEGNEYVARIATNTYNENYQLTCSELISYEYDGNSWGEKTVYEYDSHNALVKIKRENFSDDGYHDVTATIYDYDFNVTRDQICYYDEDVFLDAGRYKINRIYIPDDEYNEINYYYSDFTMGERPVYPDENPKITLMYEDDIYTNNGFSIKANYGKSASTSALFFVSDDIKEMTNCWYSEYEGLLTGSQFGGTLTLYVTPGESYYNNDQSVIIIDDVTYNLTKKYAPDVYEPLVVTLSAGPHYFECRNVSFYGFSFVSANNDNKDIDMEEYRVMVMKRIEAAVDLLNTYTYSGTDDLIRTLDAIMPIFYNDIWENISRYEAEDIINTLDRAIQDYKDSRQRPFYEEYTMLRDALGNDIMNKCRYDVEDSHITRVNISNAGITTFPERLFNMPYVTDIDATYNSINDVTIYQKASDHNKFVNLSYQDIKTDITASVKDFINNIDGVMAQLPEILKSDMKPELRFYPELFRGSSYNDYELSFWYSGSKYLFSGSKFSAEKGKEYYVTNSNGNNNFYRSTCHIKLTYDDGDCNFNGITDIADVQSTVNYVVSDYVSGPFCITAADTYTDNIINVQDIVKTVSIILDSNDEGTPEGSANARNYTSTNASPEALLYVEDGKLMITTTRPVSALDITLSSAEGLQWEYNAMSMAGKDKRIIGYTLGNGSITEGTTVLATVQPGTYIRQARMVSDDASYVTVSLNNAPTAIESVTDGDGNNQYYNASGMKTTTMQRGINIIRNADGTTRKVVK